MLLDRVKMEKESLEVLDSRGSSIEEAICR
jgi:hypothetical protein